LTQQKNSFIPWRCDIDTQFLPVKQSDILIWLCPGDSVNDPKVVIQKLTPAVLPQHPDDHEFSEHHQFNGVCSVCGWIDPQVPSTCECGDSLKEHIEGFLEFAEDADECGLTMTEAHELREQAQLEEMLGGTKIRIFIFNAGD